MVVGDVAGHDGAAAALMAMVRGRLRAGGIAPGRLAPLMAVLNRELADRASGGRFMTLFLSVLTAETRSIHWVSAGHGPVLSYDPGEDHFREIPGQDIPLGIDRHWRFHEQAHRGWSDGALLVVGTDGITEARNPGGEMYGLERLLQAVRIHCRRSAAEIVAAVMADQAAFRGGRPQGDDVTLVVVKAV
ncbi:MAG: serine/threonine-protein phosphatase [Magnetospirillum sp.]|nr:serine/threonine-protein phosphatase [Magnetospirillum sp.]